MLSLALRSAWRRSDFSVEAICTQNNLSIQTGKFPTKCKSLQIIPLHKSEDKPHFTIKDLFLPQFSFFFWKKIMLEAWIELSININYSLCINMDLLIHSNSSS